MLCSLWDKLPPPLLWQQKCGHHGGHATIWPGQQSGGLCEAGQAADDHSTSVSISSKSQQESVLTQSSWVPWCPEALDLAWPQAPAYPLRAPTESHLCPGLGASLTVLG